MDDDRVILSLAAIVVRKLGHAALKARTAMEAMSHFQAKKPLDLVIMNMRVGDMDGHSLLGVMRLSQPGLGALFIGSDAFENPMESGIAFLHKPFSPRELSEKVSTLLATGKSPPGNRTTP